MPGEPQTREVGGLVTGPDRDPVPHLRVRLSERMDESGIWVLHLRECRADGHPEARTSRCYGCEDDARAVLRDVYDLCGGRMLPTRDPQRWEEGRWLVNTYPPSEFDLRIRWARHSQAGSGWASV